MGRASLEYGSLPKITGNQWETMPHFAPFNKFGRHFLAEVASWPKERRRACSIVLLVVLAASLLILNYAHGVALDQNNTMYYPPYRWRQTLLAALSRLSDMPVGGNLIHRSLLDYFIAHGMPIMGTEYNGPVPATPGWMSISFDGARLDDLIRGALAVKIDPTLRPDIIQGAEVGWVDYMYLAMIIFGNSVTSFYNLYYIILLISCAFYVFSFRRSHFLLFLIVIFLAGHYAFLDYISCSRQLWSVHNSRLYSVLALLPAGHLLIALLRNPLARRHDIVVATVQAAFLIFLYRCRADVAWVVAIPLLAATAIAWRWTLPGLVVSQRHWWTFRAARVWPAIPLVVILLANFIATPIFADSRYRTQPATGHPFWHSVYMGLVDHVPSLYARYSYGAPHRSDEIGYFAVLADLRRRHDASPDIAYVNQGQIYINPMADLGEYDRLARRVTLQLIRDHPFATLASFYYKLKGQVALFAKGEAFNPTSYGWPIVFALLGAAIAAVGTGASLRRRDVVQGAFALAVIMPLSLVTPLVLPSIAAVGMLLVFVMAALIAVSYPPMVAAVAMWRRRSRFASDG